MLRLFADLNETTTPAAIQLVIAAAAAAVALIDKKVLFYSTESFSLSIYPVLLLLQLLSSSAENNPLGGNCIRIRMELCSWNSSLLTTTIGSLLLLLFGCVLFLCFCGCFDWQTHRESICIPRCNSIRKQIAAAAAGGVQSLRKSNGGCVACRFSDETAEEVCCVFCKETLKSCCGCVATMTSIWNWMQRINGHDYFNNK